MKKNSFLADNKWLLRKLSKFLKNHGMPKREINSVMKRVKNGNISTCIDRGLAWLECERNVDFYYFMQLRWLSFLIKNCTGEDKDKYEKELSAIYAYRNSPSKCDIVQGEKTENLILNESEFNNRKRVFLRHMLLGQKSE